MNSGTTKNIQMHHMIFGSKVVPPVFLGITEFQNQFFQKVVMITGPNLIFEELRCINEWKQKL